MFGLSAFVILVILCTTGEAKSGKSQDLGNSVPSCATCTSRIISLEKRVDKLLSLYKSSTCTSKFSSLEKKVGHLISLYISSRPVCPTGWSTYTDSTSCYRFVNSAVTKWKDARKACHAMNGDLVKIESLRENTYVFNLARSYAYKSVYMWIGLYRDANKKFIWVDGSAMSGQFSRWNTGEPNNGDGQEDCVHMYLDKGYWNDIRCNYPNKGVYMCEKNKQVPR